jgi:hypothetical protein
VALESAAPRLEVNGLLSQFGKRRSLAQQRYAQFVTDGINVNTPWSNLNGQVFCAMISLLSACKLTFNQIMTPYKSRSRNADEHRQV